MSDERLVEDTLFLACTRPAMLMGVTMEAMGLNMIVSSVLFILAGSLLYGLVALPIHLACRLVCRHDPNQFRILFAWFETRGRHRNTSLWGGASLHAPPARSPLPAGGARPWLAPPCSA